jgi:maltose O-acetyltransferase
MLRALGLNIHRTADIASMCWFSSRHVTFEEGSGCNIGCLFDGHGGITIGRNVRVGPRCCFYTTTHPVGPPDRRKGWGHIHRAITVGAGSWLHGSVLLQPGADVEPGSIITGGTVVTRKKEACDGVR